MDICDLCHVLSFGDLPSLILCGSGGDNQLLHCTSKTREEHVPGLGSLPEPCLPELLKTM